MPETLISYHTVTPYLVVPDADAEVKFLETAFGGTQSMCQRNSDHAVMHAEIKVGDSLIMVGQAREQWKALNAALYLWLENVDEAYRNALAAGARSQFEPEDKPYGHRMAGVVDPCGITWWIGSPVK